MFGNLASLVSNPTESAYKKTFAGGTKTVDAEDGKDQSEWDVKALHNEIQQQVRPDSVA